MMSHAVRALLTSGILLVAFYVMGLLVSKSDEPPNARTKQAAVVGVLTSGVAVVASLVWLVWAA